MAVLKKFEYRGYTIELMEYGTFTVTIAGNAVSGETLKGMKKKVDEHTDKKFNTFTALDGYVDRRNLCPLDSVTVLGIELYGRRGRHITPKKVFRLSGTGVRERLLKDTKENRRIWKELEKFKKETKKIVIRREAEEEEITEKLQYITPDDVGVEEKP